MQRRRIQGTLRRPRQYDLTPRLRPFGTVMNRAFDRIHDSRSVDMEGFEIRGKQLASFGVDLVFEVVAFGVYAGVDGAEGLEGLLEELEDGVPD